MLWRIEFSEKAENDLESFDKIVRNRVFDALERLETHFDELVPLPLGGLWKGFFKLRVGDWRVIYEVKMSEYILMVHYIDRRDKIYKRRK